VGRRGGAVPEPLVLVVDDEATVRHALERALRLEGYAVATAAGGREALAAVAHRPPAAVVLDVMMPDLDGVTVVRRLRADGVDVPVCIVSGATRSRTASPACKRAPTTTSSSRSPSRSSLLSREQLLRQVWGYTSDVDTNVVDVFVGHVRRKLEAGGEPRVLHTVRGVGWVLRP
jgi:two-component system response regulator MprA